jgi:type I restriction enzyme R subunit
VRGILAKLIGQETPLGQKRQEMESPISSLVNSALEAEEVIDIYAAAGAERPQISLLSQGTISKIAQRPHPALQVQILKKILNDEIRSIARHNKVRGAQLSELLNAAVLKYQNRALTDAEIIAELVEVAKEVRAEAERPAALGLSPAEAAFYDAVVQNESAVLELGDDALKEIARELVGAIRQSATLDWRDREAVRAELRVRVKAILKRRKYPPDRQESATELVLEQAKLFTEEMLAA